MKHHGKFCPFMVAGGNMQISGVCIGKDCALYREYADDCAIGILADMFADSTTCQTVFSHDTKNKGVPNE